MLTILSNLSSTIIFLFNIAPFSDIFFDQMYSTDVMPLDCSMRQATKPFPDVYDLKSDIFDPLPNFVFMHLSKSSCRLSRYGVGTGGQALIIALSALLRPSPQAERETSAISPSCQGIQLAFTALSLLPVWLGRSD